MKQDYRTLTAILLNRYGSDIISSPLFLQEQQFIQHGDVSVFVHSLSVALMALYICRRFHIRVNEKSMTRGALLHDYFLYDWHEKAKWHKWHGFHHATTAAVNAERDFHVSDLEADIIRRHMFPLNIRRIPRSREGAIVCLADKICATRETLFHRGK